MMNRGCSRGLWDKLEYVPNKVAIIRSNPAFSGKNFASLGYPVIHNLEKLVRYERDRMQSNEIWFMLHDLEIYDMISAER